MTDREKLFGVFADEPAEGWLWCSHCERCYKHGSWRKVKGLQMCPYPDCSGDAVLDPWPWFDYRYGQGNPVPENPELPVKGKVYPLDGPFG